LEAPVTFLPAGHSWFKNISACLHKAPEWKTTQLCQQEGAGAAMLLTHSRGPASVGTGQSQSPQAPPKKNRKQPPLLFQEPPGTFPKAFVKNCDCGPFYGDRPAPLMSRIQV